MTISKECVLMANEHLLDFHMPDPLLQQDMRFTHEHYSALQYFVH